MVAQDWRPRYGRLQHGELHLFDDYVRSRARAGPLLGIMHFQTPARSFAAQSQYHNELRDVKTLTGLSAITLMNKEECDVPHSFKVLGRDTQAGPLRARMRDPHAGLGAGPANVMHAWSDVAQVTTDSTFWYMFTSSRAEQEQWIAAMLKMMVALEGPRASAPASLPAPASIPTPTTPVAAAASMAAGPRSPGLRSPAPAATGAENIAPGTGPSSASATKTISAIPPRHRARLN